MKPGLKQRRRVGLASVAALLLIACLDFPPRPPALDVDLGDAALLEDAAAVDDANTANLADAAPDAAADAAADAPTPDADAGPPVASTEGMVEIPAGLFTRGSAQTPDEAPAAQVQVSAFFLDRTEVTVAAWRSCVDAGACEAPLETCSRALAGTWGHPGREQHPVTCVTWAQARGFCAALGKRLPTEAEWEKAARGPDGATYPWGEADPSCALAVMDDGGPGCGQQAPHAVGSLPAGASPLGVEDLAGNVWEWVEDGYADDAYAQPGSLMDPTGDPQSPQRVFRGGSYLSPAAELRGANRNQGDPVLALARLGFRCAL